MKPEMIYEEFKKFRIDESSFPYYENPDAFTKKI